MQQTENENKIDNANDNTVDGPTEAHPPKGYWEDAKGRLIPVAAIKDVDKARDKLVKKLIKKAQKTQELLAVVKGDAFSDIEDFLRLSAAEWGVKPRGEKGNITLTSYDGQYQVKIAIAENIQFDERLQIAKQMIDECIHVWQKGSNLNIKVLINDAFQVDKEGNISTGRVLSLRGHKITDPKWKDAMDAIADSIQVAGSTSYVRFYERNEIGKYIAISLDIASIKGLA